MKPKLKTVLNEIEQLSTEEQLEVISYAAEQLKRRNFTHSVWHDSQQKEHDANRRFAAKESQRQIFMDSLRGIAAQASLSSDAFANGKQAEIDWEDRNL